jgi:MFS superfamily sulfate permease-like transporter
MKQIKRTSIDIENNILNVKIAGILTGETAKELNESIKHDISKLKPGYHIITDLTNFRIANDEAIVIIRELLESLSHNNVGRVIRVVGNSKNAIIQSAGVTKGIDNYNVEYVPTIQDAYKTLNINQ